MSEPVKFNPNKFIKSSDEFVDHSVEAIPEESTAVVAKKSKSEEGNVYFLPFANSISIVVNVM